MVKRLGHLRVQEQRRFACVRERGLQLTLPIANEKGATLLTTLIGDPGNDRLLEDHHEDGTTTLMRTRLFEACERTSVEDYEKLDFASLLN